MGVSWFGRRMGAVAAAAAGALLVALVPQGTAYAAEGDTIALSGITAGQYLVPGSTRTVTATASTADSAESITVLVDGLDPVDEPCNPVGTTCEISFSITVPSSVGAHSVVVELHTDASGPDVAAASASVEFKAGAEPTASILSPADGSTEVGTVDVSVRGTTDPDGTDYPASFQLLVGGSPLAGATASACPGAVLGTFLTTCTRTISASAATLSAGDLSVRVSTSDGVERTSAPITIELAAAPTVSISSPADNASNVLPSADELVSFSASGSADPGLGSVAKKLELFLDGSGTPADTLSCAASTSACSGTLTWDSTGTATSGHTATVRITVLGVTGTDSVSFTLADEPTVVVEEPGAALSGAETITVTAQTDPDTDEDPKSVVLRATNATPTGFEFAADCAAPVAGSCTFTIPWDVSLLSGSYTLTAELTTTTGRTRTSPGTGVVIANRGPVVAVVSPSAGAVVKGRVTIAASSRIGTRITGHITSLRIYAGGKQIGATTTCTAADTQCKASVRWDTTLLGIKADVPLQAQVTTSTTGTKRFDSLVRLVDVRNPKPAAAFTSPTSGDVVSGSSVTIKVGLRTDSTQSDVPASAGIYRNGSTKPFDTFTCRSGAHACLAAFTWNASRSAGKSSFVVKMRTSKGRTGLSAVRSLYASSPARLTFTSTSTVDNGTLVRVSGRLVAVRTGLPLAGKKVSITRDPAIGSTVRGSVTTSSTGRFSITFTATSNTRITAQSVSVRAPSGEIYIPSDVGAGSQTVRAPMTCRAASAVVSPNETGRGSCRVAGLPFGTGLSLRYLYGGTWRTLATGTSSSSTVPFVYQFPKKGFYQLRVILSGNKVYAGTNSVLMPVTVR